MVINEEIGGNVHLKSEKSGKDVQNTKIFTKKMTENVINRVPSKAFISASTVIVLRPPLKSLLNKKSPKTFVFRKGYPEKILPNKYQKIRSYERKENVHQRTFKYDSDYPDSGSFYDIKRLVFSMFGNTCGKFKECHGKKTTSSPGNDQN